MKDKKINVTSSSGIGVITVLVFISMLTIVSFSVLSLSASRVNKNITDKTIASRDNYNNAFNLAQQKIKRLDDSFYRLYSEGIYTDENILNLSDDISKENGEIYTQFAQQIDENRYILVKLTIKTDIIKGDTFYTTDIFKTVVDTDIYTDEHIPVYTE